MLTLQRYLRAKKWGQTDRWTDGFSALYNRLQIYIVTFLISQMHTMCTLVNIMLTQTVRPKYVKLYVLPVYKLMGNSHETLSLSFEI